MIMSKVVLGICPEEKFSLHLPGQILTYIVYIVGKKIDEIRKRLTLCRCRDIVKERGGRLNDCISWI